MSVIIVGKVVAIKDTKVQVKFASGVVSDFMDVMTPGGSFKTSYIPPSEDDLMYCLFDNAIGYGVALGYAYNKQAQERIKEKADEESVVYKDGTSITYKDGVLKVDSIKEITIVCDKATIKANSISLGNVTSELSGVVTGECICPVIGAVHPDKSSSIKASKS